MPIFKTNFEDVYECDTCKRRYHREVKTCSWCDFKDKCIRCGYNTEFLNEEGFCTDCEKEVAKKRWDKFNNL